MRDFIAEVFQIALDDVPGYEGTGIPHVGMVIRRNARHTFDLARRDGNEVSFLRVSVLYTFSSLILLPPEN